jgi:low affinity Fe/Cu permease
VAPRGYGLPGRAFIVDHLQHSVCHGLARWHRHCRTRRYARRIPSLRPLGLRSHGVAGRVIVAWAVTGPLFGYSDTWQLYINTSTTIVTFLMVFLIQNTQNRDAKALHLKLDELLRGVKGARTSLVHLEQWTDDELAELADQFEQLRHRLKHSPQVLADEPGDAADAHRQRSA